MFFLPGCSTCCDKRLKYVNSSKVFIIVSSCCCCVYSQRGEIKGDSLRDSELRATESEEWQICCITVFLDLSLLPPPPILLPLSFSFLSLSPPSLKSHFDDNPRDLQVLRHDVVLQPNRVQPHLKHIPSYLGMVIQVKYSPLGSYLYT